MEHKCLIFLVFVGLICITLADHCGSRADAVPNDSDPNHVCESSSSESSSDSCSDSNDHKCPDPNQEYSDCASVCPRTCSNWWNPVTCQACRAGCKCKGDLVLNKDNRCVPVSKCPKPVCEDPRREFTEYGSVCPPACPGVNDDRDCTYQFVAGCFCRKGLLEDGNGNCVDPSCCPVPECNDPKREYDECGTACPPTCQNLNETSVICTDQCVSGCFCKYPYVEDDNGECVDPCECPTPVCSDPNRHYESCGTACPETCENLGTEIICTDDCVSGCFVMMVLLRTRMESVSNPAIVPAVFVRTLIKSTFNVGVLVL
ncbi:mucin-6-like isoform X2 [Atheta coriaria]|uniref:mucin-6-like isoform X2 n=1 Tax=Dalotia coriaria TaxID=877792 RepID=UPI0031F3653D